MTLRALLPFFFLSIVIFFPTFIGGLGLHAGQKILYLLFPLFLVLFSLPRILALKRLKFNGVVVVLGVVFISFMTTSISKVSFLNEQIFLAHFRYFAYLLVFLSCFNLAVHYGVRLADLVGVLLASGCLVAVFVLAQMIAPGFVFLEWVSNRGVASYHGMQIGGPFVWSYTFGFALVPIVFMLVNFVQKGCSTWLELMLLSILFLMVLLGQSKAAYIAYVSLGCLLCFLGFKFGKPKNAWRILAFVVIFIVSSAVFIAYNIEEFGNIMRFYNAIESGRVDASTQTRLSQISVIKYTIENNVLMGYPIEHVVIENAYGYYLYYYGLVGLVCYFFVMMYFVLKNWQLVKVIHAFNLSDRAKALSLGMFAFSLAVPLFSLANSPLDGHKAAYYFWTLMGFYFGAARNLCTSFSLSNRPFLLDDRKFCHGDQ